MTPAQRALSGYSPEAGTDFDVIVIGAGLGGLSAALHLQTYGLQVAIVERKNRVGGLCGTCVHNGREFVVACNDFGSAFAKTMEKLGLRVQFRSTKTIVHYCGRQFVLPASAGTLARLLPYAGDLIRYFRAFRRMSKDNAQMSLEELVDGACRSRMVNDLLKLPAYLMGVTPRQFSAGALTHEFEFGYGYLKPVAPVGGPQVLAHAMGEQFTKKGTLLLETSSLNVRHDGDAQVVVTDRGSYSARYVVNAAAPDREPEGSVRGLPLSMFWLVVDKSFPYPEGVHTLVHYPEDISSWFGALDAGRLPGEFGFHVFRSELPEKHDHYTMNVYFYLPRGIEAPDRAALASVWAYIEVHMETLLPGVGSALREKYFLSPAEFRAKHGLCSRVTPVILPPGAQKRSNFDPDTRIWFAGASAYPPGDHAGAAVLSGAMVAERIAADARLTRMSQASA